VLAWAGTHYKHARMFMLLLNDYRLAPPPAIAIPHLVACDLPSTSLGDTLGRQFMHLPPPLFAHLPLRKLLYLSMELAVGGRTAQTWRTLLALAGGAAAWLGGVAVQTGRTFCVVLGRAGAW